MLERQVMTRPLLSLDWRRNRGYNRSKKRERFLQSKAEFNLLPHVTAWPINTQFLRDQASDSEEVVTPLMLDGTYLSRNFATLGPLT